MNNPIGFVGTIAGIRVYFSTSYCELTDFTGNEFVKTIYFAGRPSGYFGSQSLVNWDNMPEVTSDMGFNSIETLY